MGNLYQSDMTQEVILHLRIDKGGETYACHCSACGKEIYCGDTMYRSQSGRKLCIDCFLESIDDMLETAQ